MEIYRAIKYIRLSYTDDRNTESDSVGNQRRMIDDFIAKHPEIDAVAEKIDDGYSGVLFDRPAFQEMMQMIQRGEANCVIVKDLSRLGREYIETGRYMRRIFPAYGVRFIAINDNVDTINDGADDLAVSVKNIMNEAYSRDISIKTRSALEAKRKNGDAQALHDRLEKDIRDLEAERTAIEQEAEKQWVTEEGAMELQKSKFLTAALLDKLISRIEVFHSHEMNISFTFRDAFRKAVGK